MHGELEALARVIEKAWGDPNYKEGDPIRPIDRKIADAILAAGYRRAEEEADPWCRDEKCQHRHWRSGPMPTHKRGSQCPIQTPKEPK